MKASRPVRASIVIPAHDEAATIAACLASIARAGDHEVVVVCNGCQDATARIARAHRPAVQVLELPTAGKAAALNAGDRVVHGFPRVYVDADVEFAPGALAALLDALDRGALAAAPVAEIVDGGAPRLVRSYYAIWQHLGVIRTGLCGSGVYALSAAGRRRFAEFPELIADDLFVDQRFALHERANVHPGVRYLMPPTTRALLQRKTRVFLGNRELTRAAPPCHPDRVPGPGWFRVTAPHPTRWPHLPAFLTVSALAKIQARIRAHRETVAGMAR